MPRKQKLLYQTQHRIQYTEDATIKALTFPRILREKPIRLTAIFNTVSAWTEAAGAIPSGAKLLVTVGQYPGTFQEQISTNQTDMFDWMNDLVFAGRAKTAIGLDLPFLVIMPVVNKAGFVLEQTMDTPSVRPGQQTVHAVEVNGENVGTLAAGDSVCTILQEALVL